MQEIFVEIGGIKTRVSLNQLRELARGGELAPETRIWVDGREVRYRQIAKRLIGDESAATPVSPTYPVSPVSPVSPTSPVSPVSPTPIPSADAPTRRRKTLAPVWAVAAGALLTSGAALAFFVAGNAGKKSAKPPKNRVAQPTASPNALATPSTPDFAAGQSDDAPGFATKPFDASSARVPANYRGHDPFALYEALEKLDDECAKLKKDQFETRQEHRDRIQKFRNDLPNRVLLEQLKLSSTFAFRLPTQRETHEDGWSAPPIDTLYDADAQTFAIRLPHHCEYNTDDGRIEQIGYVELRARTTEYTYDAVTRMNVPFSVTSITNRKYLLRYPQTDGSASQLTFAAVDVERAKNLTGFVAVLCVAQPSERLNETKIAVPGDADRVFYDLAARDSKSDSDDVASLDDPYERAKRFNIICAAQVSFWVYDVRNGEILAKIDSQDVAKDAVFRFGDGLNGAAAKPTKTSAARPSRTETPADAEPIASTVPFDLSVLKIPTNFLGHDLETVCDALEKLDADCLALKRDQFETTEEYRDRFEAFEKDAPNRVLFGDVKLSSVLAFQIAAKEPPLGVKNGRRALTTEYDADAQSLAIRFDKGFSRYSDFNAQRNAGLFNDAIRLTGDKHGSDGLGIAIRDSSDGPAADELKWTFVDVSVQRAKDLTGNIAALCVCRLDYSFAEIQKKQYGPKTFASSTLFQNDDYSKEKQVVRVEVGAFWFYDVRNGEILAKIPLDESYNLRRSKFGSDLNSNDRDDGNFNAETLTSSEPLPPPASFATTPFDPTATQIATDYAGHDPVAVWEAVQKIADERTALRQNDGESREEFEARIERFEKEAVDAPILDDLRASSTLAFGVATNSEPIGAWETEELRASNSDATQTLTVRFSGAIHFPRATESTDYFNFRWNDGASKNLGYGVAFRYVGPRENKDSQEFVCSFVNLPDGKGRELSGNVGLLCVCSPKIKFSGGELKTLFSVDTKKEAEKRQKVREAQERSNEYDYYSPYSSWFARRRPQNDESEPSGKHSIINALRVDDATFWFYNVKTGEIFAKVPLDDAFRGKPIPFGAGL